MATRAISLRLFGDTATLFNGKLGRFSHDLFVILSYCMTHSTAWMSLCRPIYRVITESILDSVGSMQISTMAAQWLSVTDRPLSSWKTKISPSIKTMGIMWIMRRIHASIHWIFTRFFTGYRVSQRILLIGKSIEQPIHRKFKLRIKRNVIFFEMTYLFTEHKPRPLLELLPVTGTQWDAFKACC